MVPEGVDNSENQNPAVFIETLKHARHWVQNLAYVDCLILMTTQQMYDYFPYFVSEELKHREKGTYSRRIRQWDTKSHALRRTGSAGKEEEMVAAPGTTLRDAK